jgi:transcriptional regulator with XRE-family HTH domain
MYDRALKTIRQYHRLSQAELADQLGISRSYVNEIEKNKKEPSLEVLNKYAHRFEVPLSSLMLFAERAHNTTYDKARVFVADKVLKMLEWIAEDDDEKTAQSHHSTHTS